MTGVCHCTQLQSSLETNCPVASPSPTLKPGVPARAYGKTLHKLLSFLAQGLTSPMPWWLPVFSSHQAQFNVSVCCLPSLRETPITTYPQGSPLPLFTSVFKLPSFWVHFISSLSCSFLSLCLPPPMPGVPPTWGLPDANALGPCRKTQASQLVPVYEEYSFNIC